MWYVQSEANQTIKVKVQFRKHSKIPNYREDVGISVTKFLDKVRLSCPQVQVSFFDPTVPNYFVKSMKR